MPSAREIVVFDDDAPPAGQSPWMVPQATEHIAIVEYDAAWPTRFRELADRIATALGARALEINHVGSTSVPGLPAKPIIDIDLTVADSSDERAWLPQLEVAGFVLTVREPWWQEHRCLKLPDPRCNLHVFSPDASEPWRHRIVRDHLRRDAADRARYASAKTASAAAANAEGETVAQYNARKESTIRAISARAFLAAGLPAAAG